MPQFMTKILDSIVIINQGLSVTIGNIHSSCKSNLKDNLKDCTGFSQEVLQSTMKLERPYPAGLQKGCQKLVLSLDFCVAPPDWMMVSFYLGSPFIIIYRCMQCDFLFLPLCFAEFSASHPEYFWLNWQPYKCYKQINTGTFTGAYKLT